MRLSDLKNPKAAAARIEATLKRFKEKRCMAPDPSRCLGASIIAAHTLSEAAMLRPISRDSKVYTATANSFARSLDGVTNFELKGVGVTSTFNGFCSVHDKEIFSEIEDRPFVCTPKQNFIHAFRAVAKEAYLKRRQAETVPTIEHIKQIHGLTDEKLETEAFWLLQKYGAMIGAEELDRYKARLDAIYMGEDWRRLVTHVVEFAKTPSLVCSAPYSPDFDFAGNALQDFSNEEIDLETLIVTILPAAGGGGFALFSYLDTAANICERMVNSILQQKNLTTAIIWFVVGQFENIAFSPDWFESLDEKMVSTLKIHFGRTADPANFQANRLDLCPHYIDDWQPVRIFKI